MYVDYNTCLQLIRWHSDQMLHLAREISKGGCGMLLTDQTRCLCYNASRAAYWTSRAFERLPGNTETERGLFDETAPDNAARDTGRA